MLCKHRSELISDDQLCEKPDLGECRAIYTVPRAQRPDGQLNDTSWVFRILSGPSDRFARGTVLMKCYFLFKTNWYARDSANLQ